MAQALANGGHVCSGGRVGEVMVAQEPGHFVKALSKRCSPAAQGIKAGGEQRRHGGWGDSGSRKNMVSDGAPASRDRNICSPEAGAKRARVPQSVA